MKSIFLLVLLFLNLNVYTTEGNELPDGEVLQGLNDIYNLKFENAENRFIQLQRSSPEDLKGYFYQSLIYFYKALPTRDETMYEKYLDLSEKVIEMAQDKLDKNENDYDAFYFKGLSHSYRSLLMLTLNKSLLQAASNGNDGYRILSSLIEQKPDYYDAYMGLGLYKIAIGFVPEKFQWLLSLIGFNGDINEGMKLLRTSMKSGKYTKVDSRIFLSIFSLKEKEENDMQALDISRGLTEEYPASALFKSLYSSLLLQHGYNENAVRIANEALNLNKNSFQKEISKSVNATIGTAYFRMNEFEKSIHFLEEYMKYVNAEDRYNVFLFTLGTSYEISNNRSKAIEKYRDIRDNFVNERDGELDKYFYRLAQEKIKKPLTEFEVILIKASNLREAKKIDQAMELFNEIIESGMSEQYKSDDEQIRLYFDMGIAFTYDKNLDKAAECFERCIRLNPETEKWFVPHSYFELGKIYKRKGNLSKSDEMFDNIFEYEDYDFESFLQMRLVNYRKR